MPAPGEILFITGPSGSGKSTLLAALTEEARRRSRTVYALDRSRSVRRPVAAMFGREPVERLVSRLSQVGLGEAAVLGKLPTELSTGQRWRLDLALLLRRAERSEQGLVVVDEFAAPLDEVSAYACMATLRRAVRSRGLSAVVATWREELATEADRVVSCRDGQISDPTSCWRFATARSSQG